MTWIAAAIVGSSVVSGYFSDKAADKQAGAAQAGIDAQQAMFERQVELQEPFRQAGLTAKNRLLDLLGLGEDPKAAEFGKYARDFGMDDFMADPGYAFRLKEGMKALERSAAARGLLQSGGTLRGVQRLGQEEASQEFQNAFNRYQVNRANRLQPLQSLMGASQTAANTLTTEAGNLGRGIAEGYAGMGNARASGYVGAANSITGGVGQYINYRQQQDMLNQLAASRAGMVRTPGGFIYGDMAPFVGPQVGP